MTQIYDAVVVVDGVVDSIKIDTSAIDTTTDGIQTDLSNGTDGLGALKALVEGVPTVAEFNARTLAAASYFDPAADTVANVTTVATCTTNTDMRGTDSAATASALATVDSNVDAILVDTGTTIPATIATVDSNVDAILVDTGTTLPSTLGDLATASALATIDSNVDAILVDTGTTIPGTIATVDSNVDAILVDTAAMGVNGSGLTAIPWNAAWDAEVQSEVADALTAYDSPTHAELTADTDQIISDIAALNDIAATDIVSAGAITTPAGAVSNVRLVATTTTNTDMRGTDSVNTVSPPTAAAIFDAVWDEDLSTGHVAANSPAVIVNGIYTDTDSTLPAALTAINDYIDTEVAAIKAKTDLLPADTTTQIGLIEAMRGTDSAYTGTPPTAAAISDAVWDEDLATGHVVANSAAVRVSDTLVDTANIQANYATASALATVDSNVDAILIDTGTTLPAAITVIDDFLDTEIAAIKAVTDQFVFTVANQVDANAVTSGGDGSGLTSIPWNSAWDAEVQSECADALTAYDPPTLAELISAVSPLATASALATVDSNAGAIKAKTDQLVFTTSNQVDVQVVSMATNSLTADAAAADFIGASEIAASAATEIADKIAADWVAGDASPLAIVAAIKADAEWSDLAALQTDVSAILIDTGTTLPSTLSGLATASALTTVDGIVDAILVDTGTTLPAALTTIDDFLDTEIAAIKAKTDQLTFTVANEVDANAVTSGGDGSGLDSIPWNAAWDAEVQSEVADALAAYDPPTKAELDSAVAPLSTSSALATVDSNVDAILVDTGTTIPASLATVDSNVDAILVDTGTTLPATLAGLNDLSATDVAGELATYDAPTKAELDSAVAPLATTSALAAVDSNVDAVLVDTGTTIPATLATIGSNTSDILTDTGTTLPATIAGLNDLSTADVAGELATYDAPTKAEFDTAVSQLATSSALATTDAVVDAIAAKLPADTATQIGLIEAMRGTDSAYTGTPPTAGAIAAEVLETPANKLATGSGGVVTTGSASRIASQATGFATPTNITAGNITTVSDLTANAHPEPSGVPAADETLADKIGYVFAALRNEVTVSATKKQFYNDGGTAEWKKDLSDDGTTYTETEGNAP